MPTAAAKLPPSSEGRFLAIAPVRLKAILASQNVRVCVGLGVFWPVLCMQAFLPCTLSPLMHHSKDPTAFVIANAQACGGSTPHSVLNTPREPWPFFQPFFALFCPLSFCAKPACPTPHCSEGPTAFAAAQGLWGSA